eukprot:gnl/TRDRNA2_/TRDRNA2_157135_c0_seq1.p1 gnl/TRDRNA2_/TRDRNA2_157135_c0~~gnl/TRDRNA2_/TRDRNA2_157135_c0_seq1.p1  ORF type:complete len:310 (-),score=44.52 gnl/TRDRNA2_/TRDRNA2_157135_c0_seq1:103-1032(-)
MPEVQPERRALLEEECLVPLREAGVDVAFRDGCVGNELPLDRHMLRHGGVQVIHRNGTEYTVDTTLWKEAWSREELSSVEQRMANMNWFPLAWLSFPKDVLEPQTPGFVGGHISHAELWKEAFEARYDWVMILEDDATMQHGYGLTWLDVWSVVCAQIQQMKEQGTAWDILYVGRTPSYTPEGKDVTALIVHAGYCLRTHTYCLSHAGLGKLLGSRIVCTITHRPQDEVLASLTLIANGLHHPRADFDLMLRRLAPVQKWQALAFRYDGITSPLEDLEESARAKSNTAPPGSHRAARRQAPPLVFELVD